MLYRHEKGAGVLQGKKKVVKYHQPTAAASMPLQGLPMRHANISEDIADCQAVTRNAAHCPGQGHTLCLSGTCKLACPQRQLYHDTWHSNN